MLTRPLRLMTTCVSTSVLALGLLLATPPSAVQAQGVAELQLPANAVILFVAPAGNDTFSGKLAESSAAGTDGPLATLSGARDRIRLLKAGPGGLTTPVTVVLRGA